MGFGEVVKTAAFVWLRDAVAVGNDLQWGQKEGIRGEIQGWH